MRKTPLIKVSVRELVETVLNSGAGRFGFSAPGRALEGTKAHQQLQEARGDGYQKEVSVRIIVRDPDLSLEIQGRIDGVYQHDGLTVIEEIKSIHKPLQEIHFDPQGVHFSQALVYAAIYTEQNRLEEVRVQLTYFHIKSTETRSFEKQYTSSELAGILQDITDKFLDRAREIYHWQETRNASMRGLSFPFPEFRPGQEILVDEVQGAVENGYNLFVQAPTGLGKTLATLFPSVRSMEMGSCDKIFYLTARTTTREAAETAMQQMAEKGLRCKSITLTAKEKVCFKTETFCEPDHCEYIAGYFDRLNDAARDIFTNDRFTRELIISYARKHRICPFEFSLDLSLLSDCVICDYNYLFDPRVYLTRFFNGAARDFVFLVDEAHNLVERSRDMFSSVLEKKAFLDLKRLVDKKTDADLHNALRALNSWLLETRKERKLETDKFATEPEVPQRFIDLLEDFLGPAESILSGKQDSGYRDKLLDLYYRCLFFIKIFKLAGQSEAFICTFEQQGSNVLIKLLCLDPSKMIAKATGKGRATVFFSATLMPENYFFNLFGGVEGKDHAFQLESPFPAANLSVNIVDSVSTKYRFRAQSYDAIADYLSVFVSQKQGNYLIYFPSFAYLNEVYTRFQMNVAGIDLFRQERYMTEPQREAFLEKYTTDRERSLVSFVVSGGIFGESIDLPGDQLIGVAVIGVGLPQINPERNLIRNHFETQSGSGFHYAYTYPGMNRVLQAAGRLIRTDTDRGALLLIDDRFGTELYRRLFPPGWPALNTILGSDHLAEILQVFWRSEDGSVAQDGQESGFPGSK